MNERSIRSRRSSQCRRRRFVGNSAPTLSNFFARNIPSRIRKCLRSNTRPRSSGTETISTSTISPVVGAILRRSALFKNDSEEPVSTSEADRFVVRRHGLHREPFFVTVQNYQDIFSSSFRLASRNPIIAWYDGHPITRGSTSGQPRDFFLRITYVRPSISDV